MTAPQRCPAALGLLDDVVSRYAARPALLDDAGNVLDYGTLFDDVRRLARALQERGVVRGGRVAIWTDKGPPYVEMILATLHVGAVYVPLDGSQPVARAAAAIRDAEPAVLVTDNHRLAQLDITVPGLHIVLCDDVPSPSDMVSTRSSCLAADPAERVQIVDDELVSLLYTSGSTGTPKAVQITQGNLLAFVRWARSELDIDECDVFANHACFSFDLSTFDLFVALSVGAALWVIPREQAASAAALAAGIRKHRVTVLYCVPSALHLLTVAGALTPDVVESLRYVLFAGEQYQKPSLRELVRRLRPGTRLYNFYGPTETNVCTYHQVCLENLASDSPVPIGRALPHVELRVVDDAGAEVGQGIGELIVSGASVTPGYWRRPTESIAAGHHEGRHATGDLVLRLADGTLEYRGRKDRMVKLAGYRIELGEIEAVVARLPCVAESAVTVLFQSGTPRLAVFFTVREGSSPPSLLDVKRHCGNYLPPYMLPRVAIQLDRLPRSPNGKTDYGRLATAT